MPVVTLARQCGSLGDEIARDIAESLGLRLVDGELISEVAHRLGVSEGVVSRKDERDTSLVSDLVGTMKRLYPAVVPPQTGDGPEELDETAYFKMTREVVRELARGDNAVIVGRGGTFLLKDLSDVLDVLIVAPRDLRVTRLAEATGLGRREAERQVTRTDNDRARYVHRFYGGSWLDAVHYDLVLNTGHFDLSAATRFVCQAIGNGSANSATARP